VGNRIARRDVADPECLEPYCPGVSISADAILIYSAADSGLVTAGMLGRWRMPSTKLLLTGCLAC